MQKEHGIEMLKIEAAMMGRTETVYPVLIWDEKDAVLIDTGYPGQLPLIRAAASEAGKRLEELTKVLISHQDIDHIGSLPALLEEQPDLEVSAHPLEQPYIQGEKRLLKITDEAISQAVAAMPPNVPEEWKTAFRRTLENPPKGRVDRLLAGGTTLPFGGGIVVIETPGHTPGHLSFYHLPSRTLIACDALTIEGGKLAPPAPHLCSDPDQALRSLKRFEEFDIQRLICYHGGFYRENANHDINALNA
ncbi:MBL fold metallo-hydrolase [Cohnella candidum]|uniref:MBL fold metallo-hydrolase n=1 Tax=Cohnella candidum TaxID=2674991 RepID=A0A3G3JTG8_9BACL|nr:MBL fold metallo-hydrolase [Cohnella candidum]AYQ71515.1 MBL fold metallo-hydrolase [Cohnella candidum]